MLILCLAANKATGRDRDMGQGNTLTRRAASVSHGSQLHDASGRIGLLDSLWGSEEPAEAEAEAEAETGEGEGDGEREREREGELEINIRSIDIGLFQKNIGEFSKSVEDSISLLTPLFQYIQDFQENLNTLSHEMVNLQNRLQNLQNDIEINNKIDLKLTPILNDYLIPIKTVEILKKMNGDIDNEWINELNILMEKKEILESKNGEDIANNNLKELKEIIENLEISCLINVKKCLIKFIKTMRRNNVSSILIQSKMIKIKGIIQFLKMKDLKLFKDFRIAYVYTMRWYYYFNFVKYISSLEGLKINNYGDDISLLLTNENKINEYLINIPKRIEEFNEKFNKNLKNKEIFSILGQIAESSEIKFNYEQILEFLNQSIIDNLTIENNFLQEFFGSIKETEREVDFINIIFKPVFQIGINFNNYLLNKYFKFDYIGILINIRKIQQYEYINQQRCLSDYFEEKYLNLLIQKLWPQFQNDIDKLTDNMDKSFKSSYLIKQAMEQFKMMPLQITQSYSIILSNLYKLSNDGLTMELETCEPLTNSIKRLEEVYTHGLEQLWKLTRKNELDTVLMDVNLGIVQQSIANK